MKQFVKNLHITKWLTWEEISKVLSSPNKFYKLNLKPSTAKSHSRKKCCDTMLKILKRLIVSSCLSVNIPCIHWHIGPAVCQP